MEKLSKREKTHSDEGYEWLRGDEIDTRFPASIAKSLKDTLVGNPDCYMECPQLPGNTDAATYTVLAQMSEKTQKERERDQSIMLQAEVGEGVTAELFQKAVL